MPETVKTIFQKISQGLGKPTPLHNFCHQPGAGTGSHTCSHLRSQTCSSIYGVSVIIGASLASLYCTSFYGFAVPNSPIPINDIYYLHNISLYSHFLRQVVMQLIQTGTVDVNMLQKSKLFNCVPSPKPDKSADVEIQTFVDSVSF